MFDLFAPKMLSICRQYFKNRNEAEEVMLAGFLKVFTHLNSYKSEGSFEGWIRRIMINEAISQLRKNKNGILNRTLKGCSCNASNSNATIPSCFCV